MKQQRIELNDKEKWKQKTKRETQTRNNHIVVLYSKRRLLSANPR